MTDDGDVLEAGDRLFELRRGSHPSPHAVVRPHSDRRWTWLGRAALRRLLILAALIVGWQAYAMWLGNNLLVPSAVETLGAMVDGWRSGGLPARIVNSLCMLVTGYGIGIVAAGLLTTLALGSRVGRDLHAILTAMFSPLPAVAVLPLAFIWFGLGPASLLFVLALSVVWPVGLSILAGFDGVSPTLRMVGRNYGLRGPRYVLAILLPAAFPAVLTGLRVGWAFAWRTLIASELVFGVAAGSGGLGWYIYENKNQLEIPAVFAGLATVVAIGLVVEYGIFRVVESLTVRRWGALG